MKKLLLVLPLALSLVLASCDTREGEITDPTGEPSTTQVTPSEGSSGETPSTPTSTSGTSEASPVVKSVTLDQTSLSFVLADSEHLTHTLIATVIVEGGASQEVRWTSSDPTVATVSNGLVTALKKGNTVIRATSTFDSSKYASCDVSVQDNRDIPTSDGYYLVGTKTEWKFKNAPKLTATDEESGNYAQLINYMTTVGEEFKVKSYFNGDTDWWGIGEEEANYVAEEAKAVDIFASRDGKLYVADHEEPQPELDWYLKGTLNNWEAQDGYKFVQSEETPEGCEYQYTLKTDLNIGDEFKFNSTTEVWLGYDNLENADSRFVERNNDEGDNNNNVIVKYEGEYTFFLKKLNEPQEGKDYLIYVDYPDVEPVDEAWYLSGTMNEWAKLDNYKLVLDDEEKPEGVEHQYKITLNLADEEEFKFVHSGEEETWLGYDSFENKDDAYLAKNTEEGPGYNNAIVATPGEYSFFLKEMSEGGIQIFVDYPEVGPQPVEAHWYLAGTMTEWEKADNYELVLDDEDLPEGVEHQYKITLNLEVEDEFKFAPKQGDWLGHDSIENKDAGYLVRVTKADDSDNNIKVVTGGEYTFYLKDYTEGGYSVWVEYPGVGPQPVETHWYIAGTMNEWAKVEDFELTEDTEDLPEGVARQFSITLPLVEANEFKFASSQDVWLGYDSLENHQDSFLSRVSAESESDNNIYVEALGAGDYTFYLKEMTEGAIQIWVDYPGEEPGPVEAGWYLAGTMNEWAKVDEYKFVEDTEELPEGVIHQYSITLELEEAAEFKFASSQDVWLGYDSLENHQDSFLSRVSAESESDNNIYVEAIGAGEYTFYLKDYGEGNFSVWTIYPGEEPGPQPVETHWYLAGTMNDWAKVETYELLESEEEKPEGVAFQYSITLELEEAAEFKFASSQDVWLGHDSIENKDNTYLSKNEEESDAYNNVIVETAGEYTFFLKEYTEGGVGVWVDYPGEPGPVEPASWYVAGTMTDPAWEKVDEYKMSPTEEKPEGVEQQFSIEVELEKDAQFKFAPSATEGEWLGHDSIENKNETYLSRISAEDESDNNINVETAGTYIFYLKEYSAGGYSVYVDYPGEEPEPQPVESGWYLVGTMNEPAWERAEEYVLEENTEDIPEGVAHQYSITLTLAADDEFKFAPKATEGSWLGYDTLENKDTNCLVRVTAESESDNNVLVVAGGEYTFYLKEYTEGGYDIWVEYPEVEPAEDGWYLAGSMTEPEWTRVEGFKLTLADDEKPEGVAHQYMITKEFAKEDEFKFAPAALDGDWIGHDNIENKNDTYLSKVTAEDDSYNNIKVETAGEYTFYLKEYTEGGIGIWVDYPGEDPEPVSETAWYLAGTMNEWARVEEYALVESTEDIPEGVAHQYQITITLEEDAEFKFAPAAEAGAWLGYEEIENKDSKYLTKNGTEEGYNNIIVETAGEYTFYLKEFTEGGCSIWVAYPGAEPQPVPPEPQPESYTVNIYVAGENIKEWYLNDDAKIFVWTEWENGDKALLDCVVGTFEDNPNEIHVAIEVDKLPTSVEVLRCADDVEAGLEKPDAEKIWNDTGSLTVNVYEQFYYANGNF